MLSLRNLFLNLLFLVFFLQLCTGRKLPVSIIFTVLLLLQIVEILLCITVLNNNKRQYNTCDSALDCSYWTICICIIDFGPLSITVVGCKLLSNEMAGVGAGDLVWNNRWRTLYHFLHQSTRGFLWNISRALFAILWRILRNFCQFAAEKMR